jgi:ketosteroid isomerase-like protein
MSPKVRGSLAVVVLCLLACLMSPILSSGSSAVPPPVPPDDPTTLTHWSAKQLDATLNLYAPDAVFLTAEGGRVTGTPAIRKLFQQGLASADPTITFHTINSSTSADLAYDSGEYDETLVFTGKAPALVATDKPVPPAGTKMQFHGNYLIVFRHQPDGRWLIAQHMWSGAPK